MHRVLITVRTKFLQLQPSGGVPAVFGGAVTGNPGRSLVEIGSTLGAFQGDNETNALSHEYSLNKS
jgi:hypothetical protein